MSIEMRTRAEIIKSLVASNAALIALLEERAAEQPAPMSEVTIAPFEMKPEVPAVKRVKKAKPPAEKVAQAEAELTPQKQSEPPPAEKMADIKPTKPGKTLADLRIALQECITKHGMPVAKQRLQPYQKVSDVPDEALAATIEALTA